MINIFTKHPEEVGETYLEHMFNALRYSLTFLFLFVIAFIHAIFPFLFQTTVRDILRELNDDVNRRHERDSQT